MPDDNGNRRNPCNGYRGQVSEALDCLCGLVVAGLKHGFFDYSISGEVKNNGKRQLVIRAGKSHKFTIPDDELPR